MQRVFERYDSENDEIDVLLSDGQLFKIAISNNNYEMCETLISFFENKQNPTEEQKEYLKNILEEITYCADISKEIKMAFKDYMPYEENYMEEAFEGYTPNCSGDFYFEAPEDNFEVVSLSGEITE